MIAFLRNCIDYFFELLKAPGEKISLVYRRPRRENLPGLNVEGFKISLRHARPSLRKASSNPIKAPNQAETAAFSPDIGLDPTPRFTPTKTIINWG